MDLINSAPLATAPDLEQIKGIDFPQLAYPVPNGRPAGVSVVVRQSVLNEVHRHGQGATGVEICGVLVGNVYQNDQGPFVYVQGTIRGEHALSQNAQVTFTPETWNHVQDMLEREHPGLRILGWYHTHPGFGVFLSGMDRFIHDHFFATPEQIALVFDPLAGEQGLFLWRQGMPTADEFVVESDVPADHLVSLISGVSSATKPISFTASADASAGVAHLLERIEKLEKRQRWLAWISVLAFGLALLGAGHQAAELYWRQWKPDRPAESEVSRKALVTSTEVSTSESKLDSDTHRHE